MSSIKEEKKQHLDMLQNVISRMASNSFLIKGWSVSLITAILIFADKDNNINFIYVTFLPLLIFWFLDAYYLQIEKKFRSLYEKVREDYKNNIENTENVELFYMNPKNEKVENIFQILFWNRSITPLYLGILIILIGIITVINYNSIISHFCKLVCK